jgi:vancomycin permeability regulator SanA
MMSLKKTIKAIWKRKVLITLLIGLFGVFLVVFSNVYILKTSKSYIFNELDGIPSSQAVLILGSKVYSNGAMSDVLADRVIKGLELYESEKVSKILVSGDHGRVEYDEVNVVKDYLLENGVSEEDIFLDHAGFDTYDSLYRAKEIFEIESLIIVTQEFHLPRAVYIGNSLGIKTYGYIADRQPYIAARWNSLRESLARVKAFLNVTFHSKSKYLGDHLPIAGDSRLSWD